MTYPPEPLSTDECRRLIAACSPRCPTGLANPRLDCDLWRGGLRCAEALALHPRDLDSGVLRVRRGKGRKYRTVALDPEAWAVLQAWLERKARMGIGGPVFSTLRGESLLPSYVRGLFKRLGSKAGIAKRCHAHGLRTRSPLAWPMKRSIFASFNAPLGIPAWAPRPATLTT